MKRDKTTDASNKYRHSYIFLYFNFVMSIKNPRLSDILIIRGGIKRTDMVSAVSVSGAALWQQIAIYICHIS